MEDFFKINSKQRITKWSSKILKEKQNHHSWLCRFWHIRSILVLEDNGKQKHVTFSYGYKLIYW